MRWAKERCLADLSHNVQLFERVVASVMSYLEKRAERLCDSYDEGNWDVVRSEAHFLKGTSQHLHFTVLLDLTQRIESLAPLQRVDDELIAQFKEEVDALLIELVAD